MKRIAMSIIVLLAPFLIAGDLILTRYDFTDGLVAYYRFTGNAFDESGNGHHGTVYGADLIEDRFGYANRAYAFNRNNQDYIEVPNHPDLQITQNITISIWMRHNASATGYEDIVMKGNETYGFQFNNSTPQVLFHLKQANGSWRNLNSNYAPVTGEWFHILGTYDGIVQKVYVNGTLRNSSNWSGSINSTNDGLLFGYKVASDNDWYNGDLDDFRLYNRTLPADEVLALYQHESSYISEPQDVHISISEGNVSISWSPVSGATSYKVYSADSPDGLITEETGGTFNGTSWSKSASDPKKFYVVKAVN